MKLQIVNNLTHYAFTLRFASAWRMVSANCVNTVSEHT